jgi:site-specific DNA recombinase
LGVEVHFVKENQIISRASRSNEQFVHGIKVLMARNYSQNLGEETVKGMTEKARAGIYPSYAPVGYKNIDGPNGKRVIVPDPDTALVIAELFDRFATGRHSVKSLVKELKSEDVNLRGCPLHSSVVHQILRKRLYTGDFDWDGTSYAGTHEPLVRRECWQRVQELLDERAKNKTRKVKHDFAYKELVHCGDCGCLLVGELKKRKYIYYHCTGNRGKCPEPYTRQEILAREFANVLQDLVIPEPVLEWLSKSVLSSDRTEAAARAGMMKNLQARYNQIQARIETMYLDKLDERITQEFFDNHSATWRSEQDVLLRKIQDIQKATCAPIDQALDMLRLTSRASELFLGQTGAEQRRLLQLVFKNAAWRAGMLQSTLFEPFHTLGHSNRESSTKEKESPGSGLDLGIWLLR